MAYLPLSTANLPDPVIDPAQGSSPEDYFDAFTWTGAGNTGRSFTDLSFQPDLVWAKNRNKAYGNVLYDSVRGAGANKELSSDIPGAEGSLVTSTYDYLSSFDSNGFTSTFSGSNFAAYFNDLNDSFVAWNWKANGSGVSNNVGSIPSTVSANTTSGFSIVTYIGNNTRGATIGHGLNSVPEFVMVKNIDDGAENWACFHKDLAGTFPSIKLNTSDPTVTSGDGVVIRGSEFTSSVISVGENNTCNGNGDDIIAYCFHSVEGFSKFGSFIGDGSTTASGPFVYLGFRPAFVILKPAEESRDWRMYDSKRNSYNRAEDPLQANSNASESNESGTGGVDFLSNGFKVRTSNPVIYNSSTKKIIYMAFAETPFKYSNAR